MPQQRLFVSDAAAVLHDALVTAVQSLKATDPLAPLTVLVPSHFLAVYLRRGVARIGPGHIGVHFLTLDDFAREIAASDLAEQGRRPLPFSARPIIMRQVLRESAADHYFAPVANQPSFSSTLLRTLDDLKHAGVRPQHLGAFIRQAQLQGVYRHKLSSLAALYDAYEGVLNRYSLYDDVDLMKHAAIRLEATAHTTPLFLYGFCEFTPLQRRFIAAALQHQDTFVFFSWRPGVAYEYATPALTWLTSLGLQYTPLTAQGEEQENDLRRLQRTLFADDKEVDKAPSTPDGSVTFISAPGENREAREIARMIMELAGEHGLRFQEIAVLLHDPATYGALLAETLTELGIPCFLSSTVQTHRVENELLHLEQLDFLDDPVSHEEWQSSGKAALATSTATTTMFEHTGVCIADLPTCRGVSFRAVIVPGLVEGSFPRIVRQDPILLDAERQHLGEVLGYELPLRSRGYEEDRLLFAEAVHGASERLVLTVPRLHPANGRVQTPSWYLLRALETLSGLPASFSSFEQWARRAPLSPLPARPATTALDMIEFHLASAAQSLTTRSSAPLGYLPLIAPFFSPAFSAMQQRWDIPHLTAVDGMLKEHSSATTGAADTHFSVSALEAYARCPFQYFLNVILGLSPQDDLEALDSLPPRERGSLLHDILHEFFTRLQQTGRLPVATQDRAELMRLLTQIADEHCRTFAQTKATGLPLLWELEQERIRERLALFLDRECNTDDDFLPTALEARFGREETVTGAQFFPPGSVPFTLENGETIFLLGRIDRIDVSSDQRRARIIDYKTGKPVRGYFTGGKALQLPVYFYAAQLLRPDLTWESAAYAYIDQRGGEPTCTANTWPERLAMLRQIVSALVQGIRAGWCFADPEVCHPCPFPTICGTQAQLRATRKQDDPRAALLRQLRTIA